MIFLPHALSNRVITWLLAPLVCLSIVIAPVLAQDLPLSQQVDNMERRLESEYETYFGEDLATVTQSTAEMAATLDRIGKATSTQPAVLWAMPRQDHLHLVLLTSNGEPIVRDLYDVPRERLQSTAEQFHRHISRPSGKRYLPAAQQLYDWLIGTYEAEFLEPANIDTLLVCLGDGLRGWPCRPSTMATSF